MSLKTIIVEDEPLSLAFLSNMLTAFFPEIRVIAKATTAAEAVAVIKTLQPDLVFLDIELRTGTGFEVLQQTRDIPFKAVFTTALDYMAINMIRICGVDYLQKPIDRLGLMEVMSAVLQRNPEQVQLAVDYLMQALAHNNRASHLLLAPETQGYVRIEDIVSIEMKDNLTLFILRSGAVMQSNTSLKEYELLLEGYNFFRSHQHYLVNAGAIKTVLQTEGILLMQNGSSIPLSAKKLRALTSLLEDRPRSY